MQQRRTAEEPAPPRTYRPLRQIVVFLCITYGLTLAIALALPHAGIAPLIAIAFPGDRGGTHRRLYRSAWSATRGLGGGRIQPAEGTGSADCRCWAGGDRCGELRRRGGLWGSPIFRLASGLRQGRSQHRRIHDHFRGRLPWRRDRLARLLALSPGRAHLGAACGARHRFLPCDLHLPLLLITTTYQSAGNRWIVVPMVMVTLTLAGVWYGWLRLWSGSIWPVSLSHSAFNNLMESVAGVAIVTSPATMAYVTTETGVVTMIIMVLVAGYLLTRRAADFAKAEPKSALPTTDQRAAARRAGPDEP